MRNKILLRLLYVSLCLTLTVNTVPMYATKKDNCIVAKPTHYGTTNRVVKKTEKVIIPKCSDASWTYIAKKSGYYTFKFGKLKGSDEVLLDWEVASSTKSIATDYEPIIGIIKDIGSGFEVKLSSKNKTVISIYVNKGDVLRFHYNNVSLKTKHKIKVKRGV